MNLFITRLPRPHYFKSVTALLNDVALKLRRFRSATQLYVYGHAMRKHNLNKMSWCGMIRAISTVILISLLSMTDYAQAANTHFAIDTRNTIWVTFYGTINQGDAKKLLHLIQNNRYLYIYSNGVAIKSNGGSVEEAIKIGRIIEESGWRVDVQKESVCASACFLIYVAAPVRYSEGTIIIHRPYFMMDNVTGEDAYKIGITYRRSIEDVRSYLTSHMVPDYLVEKMMSKGSTQGYTLTHRDVMRLGFLSPAMDEYMVQRCNLPTDHLANKLELDDVVACRKRYSQQARLKFLYGEDYSIAAKQLIKVNKYLKQIAETMDRTSVEYNASLGRVKHALDKLPPQEWISYIHSGFKAPAQAK